MTASRAARILFPVAAAVVLLGGCGATDDAPAERAEHFHQALADGDAAGACDDLAEETRTSLEQQEGKPCDQAITSQDLSADLDRVETEVYGSMAQVRLGDETVFLSRFDDGWRVTAAGCQPTSGDRPHDCALEAG
ncbi:MAG: hypothetical protein M3306_03160 [Actinomycetota bacterium]|nr:hypothetical protein [Actinomycetota bacterium]